MIFFALSILAYYSAGLGFMLWIDEKYHAGTARTEIVLIGAWIWLPVLAIQAVVSIRERIRRYRNGA